MTRVFALGLAAALLVAAAPVSIELPVAEGMFADIAGGPSADAINNNCLACHSTEMVTNQPRLTAAEWAASVAKMRTIYKAPVAPEDDAAIVGWLVASQGR
jgi:cytochrome c553